MSILSIQSHVVYGYAGNTAAVFPMQRLGHEVWAVNTVEFSNHTGYGSWKGKFLGGELAGDLIEGLEERGVLPGCEAVLSGYLGDASVARAVIAAVQKVKAASPKALYCCDPVMGDTGRGFYVKPDIPDIFRRELIPLADIITPNQFELEALTGIDTQTPDNARRAIEMIHGQGPGIVLVTSYRNGTGIGMLASDKSGIYTATTPELPIGAGMAGSGDITAAVFLSRYLETGGASNGDVRKTLELCTASIYGILKASWDACLKDGSAAKKGSHPADAALPLEMRIIEAQEELVSPSHYFEVYRL